MPLRFFRHRNLRIANIVGVLWAAAMFAWFFLAALYLQQVLHYSPLQVGLSFLPANLIMGAFALGLSAKVVMKFGLRMPIALGLGLAAAGLLLFVRAPVGGDFVTDVLPSMILLGFGAGLAFNPVLLAAMSDVEPTEAGLASGIVNTSFMMGGAVGLAILASRRGFPDVSPGGLGRAACRRPGRRLPPRVPDRGDLRRGGRGDGRDASALVRRAAARRAGARRRAYLILAGIDALVE